MTPINDDKLQTVRIFAQEDEAKPISCGFLQHVENGNVFDFHLMRVRSRFVRRGNCGKAQCTTHHRHAVFHLILVTDGKGTFFHNDKSVQCERGDLLCISPNESHHIGPHTKRQLQFIAITFSLRTPSGIEYVADFAQYLRGLTGMNLRTLPPQPVPLSIHTLNRTQDQLEHLLDLLLHPTPQEVEFQAAHLLLAFFGTVAAELAALPNDTVLADCDPRLERVREHIECHVAAKLTIADLAQLAGMSSGHLQRRFKQSYGSSPIAHQQQLRIQRAKRMLRDTDWPVATIAERIGYQNVYYFSTVFKQVTGLPPGKFRKSAQD